jgi:hypothetical protein
MIGAIRIVPAPCDLSRSWYTSLVQLLTPLLGMHAMQAPWFESDKGPIESMPCSHSALDTVTLFLSQTSRARPLRVFH